MPQPCSRQICDAELPATARHVIVCDAQDAYRIWRTGGAYDVMMAERGVAAATTRVAKRAAKGKLTECQKRRVADHIQRHIDIHIDRHAAISAREWHRRWIADASELRRQEAKAIERTARAVATVAKWERDATISAESKRRHAELMELYKQKREMRKAVWEQEKVEAEKRYQEAKRNIAAFGEHKTYGNGRLRYRTEAERIAARKEYQRLYALIWARDHGYAGNAGSSIRRARRKGVEIVNRPAVREFYRKMRDPHATVYCTWCPGMTPLAVNERTVDHVIPLAQGGKHCVSNFVYACRSCNSSKSDMLPDEFVEKMLAER